MNPPGILPGGEICRNPGSEAYLEKYPVYWRRGAGVAGRRPAGVGAVGPQWRAVGPQWRAVGPDPGVAGRRPVGVAVVVPRRAPRSVVPKATVCGAT
eukprot:1175504-Prorocentrum_minimum.AAC.1